MKKEKVCEMEKSAQLKGVQSEGMLSESVQEEYTKDQGYVKDISPQKKYKDTVFRMLFGKEERALSLYNGVNGTDYKDASSLQFNTLENAVFMNVKNDLSFVFASCVNLYEHQSTVPVNMPLRDLFYIADVWQKEFMNKSIYSTKRTVMPNPNFVVFYNGVKAMPEQMEMKLSDSYLIATDEPSLELKVKVLNINSGMNEELKERCPELKQYMQYIDRIRNYSKEMKLKDAVIKAVEECIRENILRDFLMEQKAEVVRMSIYEFDEEREMAIIRADERELGREEGRTEGERRITVLYKCLLDDERTEDLRRAFEDDIYRSTLCKEYGI